MTDQIAHAEKVLVSSDHRAVRVHQENVGFRLLALLCFCALLLAVALAPQAQLLDEDGAISTIRQGAYGLLLVLALLSARPWANPKQIWCVAAPITLALTICAVSLIWSDVPGIALRRLALTGVIAWTIAVLVRQLGYHRSMTILRVAILILLVANYVAVLAFPSLGIHQFGDKMDSLVGDWRGVMGHKNFAGAGMAIAILFYLFDAGRINIVIRVAIIAAAGIFLYYSHSKTAVGMLAGAIAIGYLFGKTSFSGRLAIIPIIAISTVLMMIYFNIYRYMLVQAVNDPETFTGRIVIWRHLLNYLGDHMWFGAGYGSFWNVGADGPIFRYSADWVASIASGHNGYLDIACTLGLPLAVIAVGLLIIWPFVRILISGRTVGGPGALLLSMLVFCAGHNMTESTILDRDSFINVILILTIQLVWELSSTQSSKAQMLRRASGYRVEQQAEGV